MSMQEGQDPAIHGPDMVIDVELRSSANPVIQAAYENVQGVKENV